jgi:hypothetical protein
MHFLKKRVLVDGAARPWTCRRRPGFTRTGKQREGSLPIQAKCVLKLSELLKICALPGCPGAASGEGFTACLPLCFMRPAPSLLFLLHIPPGKTKSPDVLWDHPGLAA